MLPPSLKMVVLLHSSEVYIMILAKELLGVCVTTLREKERGREREREQQQEKEGHRDTAEEKREQERKERETERGPGLKRGERPLLNP